MVRKRLATPSKYRFGSSTVRAVVVFLVGTLLLVACGTGEGPGATPDATETDMDGGATDEPESTEEPGSTDDPEPTEGEQDVLDLTGAELEEAAREEGAEVLWYNAGNPVLVESVTTAFLERYPWMSIEGVPVPFTEMPAKIATEAVTDAPTADVIWLPPTLRQGLLENDVPAAVTIEGDSALPADSTDPEGIFHPVWQLAIGIVYNTNTVDEPPTSYEELAEPEWRGRLAFDRVANLGQSTTFLSLPRQEMGDEAWEAWLDDLAANEVFITPNAGTAFETVLSGERDIAIASSNYIIDRAEGTPVDMSFGIQPVPFFNHQYLTARARHPASAKLFMEWAISEEGQTAIAEVGLSPVLAIDHANSLENFLPDGVELVPGTDLVDFADRTDDYLEALTARWPG